MNAVSFSRSSTRKVECRNRYLRYTPRFLENQGERIPKYIDLNMIDTLFLSKVILSLNEHDLNMIDALFLSKVILSLNKIKNSKTF